MYNIRNFEPKDMFAVIKIASDNLSEKYNPNLFNYFFESYPQGFIVAELGQKIIGFIIGINTEKNYAKIVMLSVSEGFQGKKIGTELLLKLEKNLKKNGIIIIELEVRTTNNKAINFYKKQGYKIVEEIKEYYQNNDDAYIMKKKIL